MNNNIKKIINNIVPMIGRFYLKKLQFPIIYYHDIVMDGGFSLQQTNFLIFKNQMEYLAKHGYKTLLFSEVEEFMRYSDKNKDKVVLITFDDGYISNYLHAFPIMKELGLKFNIFINTKMIEDNDPKYLTIENVKEMYKSGLVEFGSHTHSHIDAKSVTENELINEIETCNIRIKEWLGYNTLDFCYPYGFYSRNTNELLSKYYKRIYTSDCKPLEKRNDSLVRGRIGISTDDTDYIFKNKLKGNYDVMYLYYKRINSN
jgi:peptidoglycan/xylan/chitin deacetylase (PgdA/CDA1 family)